LRATVKESKILEEAPLDIASQSRDIEILPYEEVWEIFVKELR